MKDKEANPDSTKLIALCGACLLSFRLESLLLVFRDLREGHVCYIEDPLVLQ